MMNDFKERKLAALEAAAAGIVKDFKTGSVYVQHIENLTEALAIKEEPEIAIGSLVKGGVYINSLNTIGTLLEIQNGNAEPYNVNGQLFKECKPVVTGDIPNVIVMIPYTGTHNKCPCDPLTTVLVHYANSQYVSGAAASMNWYSVEEWSLVPDTGAQS